MKVSVILPFYNAEKTLKRAIESILRQSFTDFELLLVNNNSTDASLNIVTELAKTDSRITIFNESEQGVAHAMNCGMQNSHGKFISRMDADDISYPERLEKQVRFLTQNTEIDFIGSEVKYVSYDNNTKGFQRFVDWVNFFHTPEEIENNRFVEIPVVNPTIMFRRELFEKLGGCFEGDFPEDYEMQLRYLDAGVKMFKLPEPLLEWHDSPGRLTRTDLRYSSEAFFKTKATYFKKWSEIHNRFHPEIWIWGAGRKTRQRSSFLKNEGLQEKGRIDIVSSKPDAIFYKDIPGPGEIFIVSMVTNSGAGKRIKEFLTSKNYVEGEYFILMG